MKTTQIITTLLLLFIGGYLIGSNYRIAQEVAVTEAIIQSKSDYLQVGSKEAIHRVIEDYYKKAKITTPPVVNLLPTAKIRPSTQINLQDIKVIDKIAVYIKVKEGFRAKAYKDNTQYSIGYGTRATSRSEIITVKEANVRLYKHIRKVIVPAFKDIKFTSLEQVYSAIDFSYNLGHNRFKREIVNEDGYMDCYKMMAYNKIRDKRGNLVYSESLAKRRFENFLNCAAFENIGVIDD